MALTWNIGECNDHEELWIKEGEGQHKLDARTEALIYLTMSVGLDAITEQNCNEFFCRLAMIEQIDGAFFYGPPDANSSAGNEYFTLEHIKRRIGLRTNATTKTQARFHKGLIERLRQDVQRKLSQQEKEMPDVEQYA